MNKYEYAKIEIIEEGNKYEVTYKSESESKTKKTEDDLYEVLNKLGSLGYRLIEQIVFNYKKILILQREVEENNKLNKYTENKDKISKLISEDIDTKDSWIDGLVEPSEKTAILRIVDDFIQVINKTLRTSQNSNKRDIDRLTDIRDYLVLISYQYETRGSVRKENIYEHFNRDVYKLIDLLKNSVFAQKIDTEKLKESFTTMITLKGENEIQS